MNRLALSIALLSAGAIQAFDGRVLAGDETGIKPASALGLVNFAPRHGDDTQPVSLPPVRAVSQQPTDDSPLIIGSSQVPETVVVPETVGDQNPIESYQDIEPSPSDQALLIPNLVRPTRVLPNAWWQVFEREPMQANRERAAQIDIETIVQAALEHSPYVQSLLADTQIQEAEIDKAWGEFDPTRFAESIFRSTSDPVGNTLTTGGPPRLEELGVDNSVGLKRKNLYGGTLQGSQDIFFRDNNSLFFAPEQQADTKLAIRYTQPLMRGSGQFYNRSAISVAEIQYGTSLSETRRVLQQHVVDITQTYWELYNNRCQILQIKRGTDRLDSLRREIERRQEIDGIESQILLATALIANQNARMVRASSRAVTAEMHLRRLVNAPWLTVENCDELIPVSTPFSALMPVSADAELQNALSERPDVIAIRDRIKAATVKLKVAENELKPTLNLVTSVYVHGLTGDYDLAQSYGDQFAEGRPSVTGGLSYQRPRNNRVAESIKRQKNLELQKLLFDLDETLLKTKSEIYAAIADVNATYSELESAAESAMANVKNVEYLSGRWQAGSFVENTAPAIQLQQLLNAEQDLITAENNWAVAEANYMISLAVLKFRSGDLLNVEPLTASEPAE